jgi:multiple sugar transport system permease protein
MRKGVKADTRLDFGALFFDKALNVPLTPEAAGRLAEPLEMVRRAPSAVNKQPWRAVVDGDKVHFFEKRSKGYVDASGWDLQKVDLGIALKNTLFYTLVTVPLTLVCAVALALALNKAVKGAVGFRTIFFFPYVASMVAICVCWRFMMMKDGPINQFIMALGINFNKSWTADSGMAIWSIILVSVWRNMGYYMVIYLAALQGVPTDLYEAATMDGANKWQQFLHVTLPQLRPTTFFASTMMIISCFKIYDVVAIMTEGGPGRSTKMLVTYIYDEAFSNFNYGIASAIAMVLLVIVLIFTLAQFSMEDRYANN